MGNPREQFSFVLILGTLLLSAVLTTPAEEAVATLFAPSPEPELHASLSPAYFSLSPDPEPNSPAANPQVAVPPSPAYFPLIPEPNSPAANSPGAEPLSESPLYSPENSPSLILNTGYPPELSTEISTPGFSPVLLPYPENEPADTESSDPSISLPFPYIAPSTEDNDPRAAYEPLAPSYPDFYQASSDADVGIYKMQDGTRRSSIMYGVVAAVCMVGLGGFVYLKKHDNRMAKSKYDQYLELSKKDNV